MGGRTELGHKSPGLPVIPTEPQAVLHPAVMVLLTEGLKIHGRNMLTPADSYSSTAINTTSSREPALTALLRAPERLGLWL